MNSIPYYTFAHVGISPLRTLEETAAVLGEIFGLSFLEDIECRYDEFPAYIAEAAGLHYALLGVPLPEDDVRDNPTDDFELIVKPISIMPGMENKDISDQLTSKIKQDGRINCWTLKSI